MTDVPLIWAALPEEQQTALLLAQRAGITYYPGMQGRVVFRGEIAGCLTELVRLVQQEQRAKDAGMCREVLAHYKGYSEGFASGCARCARCAIAIEEAK